ncbi:hypothetical protein AB0886_27570 [Streptomyces sp. NPDC024062]|uniref:hypothetical protein n=1 Tax=unclassified Streptomyces TaxID=2593676 RepID=UPI00341BB34B
MSNDNVAVLTTLNGAVLLIGTVQYTKLLRQNYQAVLEMQRERLGLKAALIEAKRRGDDMPIDDLLKLKVSFARLHARNALPALLASFVWFCLCTLLVKQQIDMLVWIGTANPGPDPGLAKSSFAVTAAAIVVLVIEGYFASIVTFVRQANGVTRSHRELYTTQEREDLHAAVRAARPSVPAPTPSPPPGSLGPVS